MHTHPEIGARLLSRPEFGDLREWVLSHHERPDGLGYPRGLREDQIPLEARILAVADAYEAMTADRCYRPALGEAAARAELEGGAGTQFDATVVGALLRALDASRTRRLRVA
jgi:HD-GYP domain-containing protein (c-di-GMP phosphodiesterase class II)